MYEININATTIRLIKGVYTESIQKNENTLIARYNGKRRSLLNYIDKSEKSSEPYTIYIHHSSLHDLKEDFFSLFQIIKAAGGLVLNENGEILLIFRRGNWDLPKGKKEKKESKRETAKREVQEETGIQNLKVLYRLIDTFHTYKIGKKRTLKISHWYLMESNDTDLLPQTEEDIEKVEWVSTQRIEAGEMVPMYPNINKLLKTFFQLHDFWKEVPSPTTVH